MQKQTLFEIIEPILATLIIEYRCLGSFTARYTKILDKTEPPMVIFIFILFYFIYLFIYLFIYFFFSKCKLELDFMYSFVKNSKGDSQKESRSQNISYQ